MIRLTRPVCPKKKKKKFKTLKYIQIPICIYTCIYFVYMQLLKMSDQYKDQYQLYR